MVYSQTLRHEFINYDDDVYVYENPPVFHGLSMEGVKWAFTKVHTANWHPITWLSHMLDCEIYGLKPWGHHLTNVLLHAANTILLFLVLRQMTGAFWRCAFVAALWAIHPLRVESVAWIAERKDLLCGLFCMLTLLAYARYVRLREQTDRLSVTGYLLIVVFFALGLMSKPMLVTLPFVLLLLDYWPLRRFAPGEGGLAIRNCRLVIGEKLPLLAMSAASCVITVLAQRTATVSIEWLPPVWRIGNTLVAYVVYLKQMVYPVGLAVMYPHPGLALSVSAMVFSFVILAGISAAVILLRRKHPYLLTGWLWYLGMLVPVIGLMQVGEQAHADRYTYLPQIGLYVGLAWAAANLTAKWRHRKLVCGAAATLVLVPLLVLAWTQTARWRNGLTLWTHTLHVTSRNQVAHNNLGVVLGRVGREDEAIEHYRQALRINPKYAAPHCNLGLLMALRGDYARAIEHYREALRLDLDHVKVHNYLGIALASQGRFSEAIEHFRKALQSKPDDWDVHGNLANALAAQGKKDEASEHYQRALQIRPDAVDPRMNYGNLLLTQGKLVEAMEQFEQAQELAPDHEANPFNMGNVLAMQGKRAEAIEQYREALRINPEYEKAHSNLANLLFEQRQFAEAVEHYRQALRIRPGSPDLHYRLGRALASQGKSTEAIEQYRHVLKTDPNHAPARNRLGELLLVMGRFDEAGRHFFKVLETAPNDIAALNNAGWLLATAPDASLRDGPRAVELGERASRLAGGENPALLDTLAAAYAEAGRFAEAVRTARRALELAMAANDETLANGIRKHLQVYQAGSAYREPGSPAGTD